MLRTACIIFLVVIVAVSFIEFVWNKTPLEQLQGGGQARSADHLVIRLGIASWQMGEFPWAETIRKYEEAHGGKVKVEMTELPEGAFNSMQAFWRYGHSSYDVIVAWADEEIHPFIHYKWNSTNPADRSLIINVNDYLTPEQLESFMPALFGGCSRIDPQTGKTNRYELPWMGEVLALNYNKLFFKQRGIDKPPETWDEVEEVSKKLMGLEYEGKKVAPLAMNFAQTGFFAQNCYIPMLAAFKQGRGVTDEKGRMDVSSPEAARVFETLKKWRDAGYVSTSCMVSSDVEQDLRVMRAAMYPHWQSRGLWAVKDHGPDVIGIAPTPGALTAGSLVCTYGCIIPKCSPIIKEAVAFSYETFCTDTYGFQTAVAQGGKMPATRDMYHRKDLPGWIADMGRSLDKGYGYPDLVNWSQCSDILVVEFQKYLRGEKNARGGPLTAAEALKNVQRRFAEEVYRDK